MPKSVCLPSWSRDLQSGMHSITPHCGVTFDHSLWLLLIKICYRYCRRRKLRKIRKRWTYSWGRSHHPVRKYVEVQAHHLEDVFKQADDLKSQHVLQKHADKRRVNTMTRTRHGLKRLEITVHEKDRKHESKTCLQSSPTLKMAACQQILLASSSLFPSSKESERHCRPERKMSWHTICLSTHLSCTVSTLEGFNACSTFFLQLTDTTPPNFELGQVGSFGSTDGDTTRLSKSAFSLFFLSHFSIIPQTIFQTETHLCMGVPDL